MSIFGQFYPLKDMIQNMEIDQLDELYNSTKAVFWFSEVVQKSVSSLHKSANVENPKENWKKSRFVVDSNHCREFARRTR